MARDKRARSLAPSFVFVAAAAAAACGGTSVGETPLEPSNAGSAGAQITTNPPRIGYGGSTNPPPIGWSGSGGYGNEGGNRSYYPQPIVCPASVPLSGSVCVRSLDAYECDYGTGDPCTETLAWCSDGVWSLGGYAIDCGFAGAGVGGETGGGPPIAEAGAAGEAPTTQDPVIYCPQALPTLGAACFKPSTVTSYRCDYALACGAYEATCNGHWQLTVSPTDGCAGGAPGN